MRRILAALAAATLTLSTAVAPAMAGTVTTGPQGVTATLDKTADGTGHGSSTQTFITTANGFPVGDDSPTDGVVASGDAVSYRITMAFLAGQKRTVNARIVTPVGLVHPGGVSSWCKDGDFVKTDLLSSSSVGSSCRYNIPAGASETMTYTFSVVADDTYGEVITGATLRIRLEEDDNTVTFVDADPVTVVSAPSADLALTYPATRMRNWRVPGGVVRCQRCLPSWLCCAGQP